MLIKVQSVQTAFSQSSGKEVLWHFVCEKKGAVSQHKFPTWNDLNVDEEWRLVVQGGAVCAWVASVTPRPEELHSVRPSPPLWRERLH